MTKKRKLTQEEMKKHSFQTHLEEEFKNPKFEGEFKEGWRKLDLGYQIFCAREAAGMTQMQFAKRIGTRQSNISRLEQGEYNFTVQMLEKIARALHARLKIEFYAENFKKAA